MKDRVYAVLVVSLLALGTAFSALLAVSYLGGASGICGAGGCDEVRNSAYSSALGIPLPIWGLGFYAALALAFAGGRQSWLRWLAGIGAAGAIALVAIQAFVIGAFCPMCLVVDVSTIALAVIVFAQRQDLRVPRAARFAGVLVPVAACMLALLAAPRDEGPSEAAVPSASEKGLVITEFVDFECPYCRKLHVLLHEVLRDYPSVKVVRHHVPLPNHRNAEAAARAACCAEEAGLGEAMADRLFRAKDLSVQGCAKIASELGVEASAYGACIDSERVNERIAADKLLAKRHGVRGLPTFFVGDERFVGLPSEQKLRASIARLAQR